MPQQTQQKQNASRQQQGPTQQLSGTRMNVTTKVVGTALEVMSDQGFTQYKDKAGHTWQRVQQPQQEQKPKPPQQQREAKHKPLQRQLQQPWQQPGQSAHTCTECGDSHHTDACPVLYPASHLGWAGPPRGNLHLYRKYLSNALKAGLADSCQIRPFITTLGHYVPYHLLDYYPSNEELTKVEQDAHAITVPGFVLGRRSLHGYGICLAINRRTQHQQQLQQRQRQQSKQPMHPCSECSGPHSVQWCPVLYPRRAPAHWKPPKGDLGLYCKYVTNARLAGFKDRNIKPFIDAEGKHIRAATAVPHGLAHFSESQDGR